MELSKQQLETAYHKIILIRRAEEAFQRIFHEGKVPGFIHLYLGEEAVAAGVCMNLNRDDYVTSTHRGHGHFIAKGSSLKGIAAEIMGKSGGLCRGRGGSMHMSDMENGLLCTTGIVGGGFPLAAGLGLSAKYAESGQVSVCFFGDGAVNEGSFHEAINLAAIWSLPVIFVCENNLYAQSTPQAYHQKVADIARRAEGYGVPGLSLDGMDFFAVYQGAKEAVERARRGEGPTFLECKTYLYSGHYVGDVKGYRYPQEMEYYRKERDCAELFRRRVLEEEAMTEEDFLKIEEQAEEEVREAAAFAEASPYPDESELTRWVE